MDIDTKELSSFADKHLDKIDDKKTEAKAWVDSARVMAIKSDRLAIVKAFGVYEEMQIERYNELEKTMSNNDYVNAYFDISYLKDVLKLMTTAVKNKRGNALVRVKVSLGNDRPMKLTLVQGEEKSKEKPILEVILANRRYFR
jgi:acyl carrier protein phosphodiesterase